MNKLLLVRHGQSIGNASGIIQGKSDYSLSDKGKRDVIKLVTENKALFKQFDGVISSTLSRAYETATIICNELNKKIILDSLIEEFDAGILEGLKKVDVQQMYPKYYNIWINRGDLDMIPGAEKGDMLQARVLMFLEKYLNSDSKEIVVSHAGFLRVLINTIYARDRQCPIDLDHNTIYCLEDVWKNIGISEYTIAKNSRVFEIDTFDKKYIMKKSTKREIQESKKEKALLEYLSQTIYTPQILALSQRDKYILKIMNHAVGTNIHTTLNKEKIDNTTIELYRLKQLLQKYDASDDYETFDIIAKLNLCLLNTEDIEVKKIIDNILGNEKFNNGLQNDSIQLVHDDLHRDNILYEANRPIFLDFEGLKKWPSTYQLASHIAANYLLYDDSFNIDIVLQKWPENIDFEYLKCLIMFRLIQGFNYFNERVKSKNCSTDDYEFEKIYKKSLIKISMWEE